MTHPPPSLAFPTLGRVVRGMREHGAFEAAAAVAFWSFLSLLPLLVLGGFLVGQVARMRGVDALVGPLLDVVPPTAEDIVRTEVERLARSRTSRIAPLGVAGYLWTASSAAHNLMDVFESVAVAPRRAWWQQRVLSLVWVVVGLASAVSVAWVLVQLEAGPARPDAFVHEAARHATARAVGALHHHARAHAYGPEERLVAAALTLPVGTVLLAGFYRFAIQRPRRAQARTWVGAVMAIVCWLVVSWGFGAYAVSIGDYAVYYGSLAAVAVLLVWLYLSCLSLVLGAELNAQLEAASAASGRAPRRRSRSP